MSGWPAASALVDDDVAVRDQLSTPNTPGLALFERGLEALSRHRALRANGLGPRDVEQVIGEEEPGGGGRTVVATGLRPPATGLLGDLDWIGEGEHDFLLEEGSGDGENQKGRRDVIPTAWGFLDACCCLRRDLPGPSGRGGHGVVLLGSHKGYRVGPPRVARAKRARTRRARHHCRIRSDIRAHHSDSSLLHPSVRTTESAVSAPHFRP